MAALPESNHTIASLIYNAYEADAKDSRRPHLGASLIGHHCERYLWLTFRWAGGAKFPGRMLRLFETGSLEEERLVKNLRRIGVEVHDKDADGKQWSVSAVDGHFGGSLDGVALNIPEAPKTWHVLEFKTHNDKSFKDLVAKSVRQSKPQHFAQMQIYMGLQGLKRALYMAVNKNDDTVYTERLEFDQDEFSRLMERAERVIRAAEPPLRVSNDPAWWQCKSCNFYDQCHGTEMPDVNCRTCAHSTPVDGAEWNCEQFGIVGHIAQLESHNCPSHRYIPMFFSRFASQTGYHNGDVEYTLNESKTTFKNGEGSDAFSSLEVKSCVQKEALGGSTGAFKAALADAGIPGTVIA
jgi:hypothetical protein